MTNKQSSKSIAVTPVIRAKTSADAFISGGHNHDNLYIRYNVSQPGLDENEINQFLSNINAANSGDPTLIRADLVQDIPNDSKIRARTNIGLIDDRNIVDQNGNIAVSKFGNLIGASPVLNNNLLSHFVRHDAAQPSLTPQQKTTIATNTSTLSLLLGASAQTILSSLTVSGADFTRNGPTQLTGRTTIQGTPSGDTLATVRIADPATTSIITISSASGTTDNVVAMSCGNKRITNLRNPVGAQDGVTKIYVDNLLDSLDFDANYMRTNGENAATGPINANGFNVINLPTPSQSGHATNKQYVDASTAIVGSQSSLISTGFDATTTMIQPTSTGKYLVIVSGRVNTGSASVLSIVVNQGPSQIATRSLNTGGVGQWSMTIPISVSTTANPLRMSGPNGVVFNQFDLVKIGS